MSRKILGTSLKIRDKFMLRDRSKLQWFPGHMKKGVDQIQSALHNIDAVIEVHDARIPFSGRNNQLRDIIHVRPHVLLLNKCDLADLSRKNEIREKLLDQGISCIQFTECVDHGIIRDMKKNIVPLLMTEMQSRPRFRVNAFNECNILVIGVPNVGKSTILNKFRQTYTKKRKAAKVGAMPGVTRSVMNKVRVNYDPDMFVIDTPGILSPKISNNESGMRLAACDCIPNRLVGSDVIVDYLLYWLNNHGNFSYVNHYGLDGPTDDYMEFLAQIAMQKQLVVPIKDPNKLSNKYRLNFEQTANLVLKDFQAGYLGKVMFDEDYLNR